LEDLYSPKFSSKKEHVFFYLIYVFVIFLAWLPCLIFVNLPPTKTILDRFKKAEIRLLCFQNEKDEKRAACLRRDFFASFVWNINLLGIILIKLIVITAVLTFKWGTADLEQIQRAPWLLFLIQKNNDDEPATSR